VKGNGSLAADAYALLQAGLDHIGQGISVFDERLRLVGWNRRFIALLDFPEPLIHRGVSFAELIRFNAERGEYGPGDVDGIVARIVSEAERFLPHTFERTRPNGTILAIRGEPLPEGGFVTVYTDITEQRRFETLIREQNEELERRVEARTAELKAAHDTLLAAVAKQEEIAAALRLSESRLSLITDSLPAGIAYWDRNLRCLFANKRFAAAFGFDKQEIVGRDAPGVVGEKTLGELMGHIDRVRAGEAVTFEYETMVAGHRAATIRTWLVPEVGEQGAVPGFFILSLDITRQKAAEAAILQAAKMEGIGQLSSGIAHDFNNLLTVILGNLVPLKDHLSTSPAAAELLDPAIEAARRGADLTQRLLSFARRQALEPKPVDIEDLIIGLVRLLRRSLPSDIEIVTATKGTPYPALVDPHQLENALLNLALNARDAMPKGGRLTFETTFVALGAAEADGFGIEPGAYVQIVVADSGAGMDDRVRARVFEPFFTTKEAGRGSGLGLSMVYGFVKQSRGAVAIDSTPEQGTRVVILLPRAAEAADRLATPADAAGFRAAAEELVLLVEDDDQVRKVIRRQLTGLGFRLIEAGTAAEALALLQSVPDFSLLVSDVVMPGTMTGIDLGDQAKALKPELKVVLMTGYAGRERTHDLDRCPFPVLRKPFSREQLISAIRTAA
jgi:PAS domain S-box-containing protein